MDLDGTFLGNVPQIMKKHKFMQYYIYICEYRFDIENKSRLN